MSFQIVDYVAQAKERVTSQFKNKIVFNKFVELLLSQTTGIQKALYDLYSYRSIDMAFGAQLDNIGEIVGQERILIDANIYSYFGFADTLNGKGFGQAPFYEYGQALSGNIKLDDETYRLFIKAKIAKNVSICTPEQYMKLLDFVFGGDGSTFSFDEDAGVAAFTVYIGRLLSPLEVTLLNHITYQDGRASRFIPKPIGVRVNFGHFNSDEFFGFEGMPNAKGFSELWYNTYTGEWEVLTNEIVLSSSALYDGSVLYDGSIHYNSPPVKKTVDVFAGNWTELIEQ